MKCKIRDEGDILYSGMGPHTAIVSGRVRPPIARQQFEVGQRVKP